MDVSNFWWQSPAAPDTEGKTLRFRGGQSLTGHSGGSGTASVWIKRGTLGVAQTVMSGIAFAASDTLNSSVAVFRDPSAWMHVVVSSSGTYVNGVSVSNGSAVTAGTIGASCDLYLAEFHFVDGQSLDFTDFGEFDANGVWVPKKYTGTHGAQGFYLDFSDPDDIGADRSGRGNNFTPNGFELSDQTNPNWDQMEDSPTQNWSTFNELVTPDNVELEKANLGLSGTGANSSSISTVVVPQNSGSYYFEITPATNGDVVVGIGVMPGIDVDSGAGGTATSWSYWSGGRYFNQNQMPETPAAFGAGDVVGVQYNSDAGTLRFTLNGVMQPAATWQEVIQGPMVAAVGYISATNQSNTDINFGQRPFIHQPAGFKAWNSAELPAAPIPNGRDHFQVITDTGPNILTAAQTAFPNSLIWIKDRVNSNQHQLVDSVNGTSAVITSPAGSTSAYVAPAGSSVAWCWNAANTDGGFSITNGTHGLGATPAMVIDRALNVWHQSLPAGQGLALTSDSASTSQAWTIDGTTVSGPGGGSYYTWSEIPGYSAFGTYEGNGDANGPFIYTGFRPALVILKGITLQSSWNMYTAETMLNPINNYLVANAANSENTPGNGYNDIDILSNGFKIRDTLSPSHTNQTGATYSYCAFAENPFGGSNVSPANAR